MESLVENRGRFLSFLMFRVANPSDAEDILQEALVKAAHSASLIRKNVSAEAWFYRILRNAIVDYYRRRDSKTRALGRLAEMSMQESGEESYDAPRVCRCVHNVLPTLRGDYSLLLKRVTMDGTSISAIAGEMGLTTNNVRVKLHRARNALGKSLRALCGECCVKRHCFDCDCVNEVSNAY